MTSRLRRKRPCTPGAASVRSLTTRDGSLISDPLPREEFVAALRAQGARYWDKHPFHVRLHEGSCTQGEMQAWVANRWYYHRNLSQKNGAIIANCPLPEVRRRWVERIVFQDGMSGSAGGGLEDWLVLAEAVGLTRQEVREERHLLPGVRLAVDSYVYFCLTRPWIEGAAAALTELFSPDLMTDRLAVFKRHYPWIDAAGYGYFEARIPRVRTDSEYDADMRPVPRPRPRHQFACRCPGPRVGAEDDDRGHENRHRVSARLLGTAVGGGLPQWNCSLSEADRRAGEPAGTRR
jgi:pyrroloquinoline-quinone synthase